MIKPMFERVLLEKVETPKETTSGILLPEASKNESVMARVVEKGEGRLKEDGTYIAIPLNIGDLVLFNEYAAKEIKFNNKEYLLVDMKDVLAIVKEA